MESEVESKRDLTRSSCPLARSQLPWIGSQTPIIGRITGWIETNFYLGG